MTDNGIHPTKKVSSARRLLRTVSDYLVFSVIMFSVFYLTFNTPGKLLSDALASVLQSLRRMIDSFLLNHDINPAFIDLIVNGILPGVGSVLAFVPVIAVLFILLGILQESGYLDKAAAVLDRPLRSLGLSGQCAIPLITGFGCAVPAVMAAEKLPEKISAVRLIPFMSCSARLPVYAMFISCFFPEHRAASLTGIYSAGILCAVCAALILKTSRRKIPLKHQPVCRCIHYRMPDLGAVLSLAAENVLGFIRKAFTVIFTASVLIWYLQSYGCDMQPVSDSSESILAILGKAVSPVFEPLGFDDWRAASAVIAGLSAKEAVISTFVVTSAAPQQSLFETLNEIFTPLSAFSFMLFCLLYMPCIATLCAVRNAAGSWKESALMAASHLIIAWCASFAVYNVGTFISGLI